MKTTSYYPVLLTHDVKGTADFWRRHFGMKALYENDWYVHLQSNEDRKVNLGICLASHVTVPAPARGNAASGLVLNFEVADVDAAYARAKAEGLPILLTLRDEDFGQRHFITSDPNGVLIDVITPIPPTAEYAANYAASALPSA